MQFLDGRLTSFFQEPIKKRILRQPFVAYLHHLYQNAVFNVSEQQLVEQCLNGKRSAWQELYERYKTPLFRLCLRYAANRQEAEDWLQDAFIKAFADLAQYRGGAPLGAWLRKVSLNTVLQNLRKKKTFFTDTDIATFSDHREAEDVHILADIDAQRLIALMQKLPDGYRTVFNLYVIEGYTHEEISNMLGIQSGTSKSQLSKAKAMMRNMLNPSPLTHEGGMKTLAWKNEIINQPEI